jgi:hypothetical protein
MMMMMMMMMSGRKAAQHQESGERSSVLVWRPLQRSSSHGTSKALFTSAACRKHSNGSRLLRCLMG